MRSAAVGFGLEGRRRLLLLLLLALSSLSLVDAIGCWRVGAVAEAVVVFRLAGRVRSGVVRRGCRVGVLHRRRRTGMECDEASRVMATAGEGAKASHGAGRRRRERKVSGMLAAARALCDTTGTVRCALMCGTQRCCSRRVMCSERRAERANVMHERQAGWRCTTGQAGDAKRLCAAAACSSSNQTQGNLLGCLLASHVMWESDPVQ